MSGSSIQWEAPFPDRFSWGEYTPRHKKRRIEPQRRIYLQMMITSTNSPVCTDCGGEELSHNALYVSLLMEELARPFAFFGMGVTRILPPPRQLVHTLSYSAWKYLGRLGIADLRSDWDEHTLLLAQVLWAEARRRGILMQEVRLWGLPRNLFIALL